MLLCLVLELAKFCLIPIQEKYSFVSGSEKPFGTVRAEFEHGNIIIWDSHM